MNFSKFGTSFIILFFFILNKGLACSAYKITVGNSTMCGVNYDAWFTQPRIWFETDGYGAAFTGANYQGNNDLTPQAGMNEFGLAFGTLATETPQDGVDLKDKKHITSRSKYLKDILHTCKTVEDVKAYIEQYNHSELPNDVFIYTEKSGKYLIVEPYKLILGSENKYVLANFCPSTIKDVSTITQPRYLQGTAFLKNKIDTSLAFCTSLSDTMHVCRKKIGDGTLLTSISDLNEGNIHLYFYHDYKHCVTFNVKEELAKGNHSFEIPALFPQNTDYQKLIDFQTPKNNIAMDRFLQICFALFVFSFAYFGISYVRNKNTKYAFYQLFLAILSLGMAYYMFVLASQLAIFYLPAPYQHYKFSLINFTSYLPYLLLLLIIPFFYINRNIIKESTWRNFSTWLFLANNLAYLGLIMLFFYWGFYHIW